MSRQETLSNGSDNVELVTLETPGLGNRSYLAIADGWAVAVDVQRDLDRVHEVLQRTGARLSAVLETHIHNDYVTGGLALAKDLDAEYVVPAGPELSFPARRAKHNEVISVGPLTVRVINTPGHTDAHSTYSMHIGQTPALAAFTGGSLLLGGTGRTDLLGKDRAQALAIEQYWTARRLVRMLPGDTRLLPTHGFGSHCLAGQAVKVAGDRLADQLEISPAFLLDEEGFVQDMLDRLGPIPAYFPKMAPRNVAGPSAADLRATTKFPLADVAQRASAGQQVIDVRARHLFADGHLPGTVSVDATAAVATWIGWVADIDAPITIVAENDEQLVHVQRELSRIGVDQISGYSGALDGVKTETLRTATFPQLARRLRSRTETSFVDVRDTAEWRTGHIKGALHVPAYQISRRLPDDPHLYCGVGFRATIAGSILARDGVTATIVDDGLARARRAGLPWCDGSDCSDDRCRAALVGVK